MQRLGRLFPGFREAFASFSPNARIYLLGQALLWTGTNRVSLLLILVLAWLHWLPPVILAYFLRQALMNMSTPIQDIFVLELVAPSRMNHVNAVKMLAWTGSWAISARLSGLIIYQGGFAPSFTLTATLYGLSSALFWLFFLRRPRRTSRVKAQPVSSS